MDTPWPTIANQNKKTNYNMSQHWLHTAPLTVREEQHIHSHDQVSLLLKRVSLYKRLKHQEERERDTRTSKLNMGYVTAQSHHDRPVVTKYRLYVTPGAHPTSGPRQAAAAGDGAGATPGAARRDDGAQTTLAGHEAYFGRKMRGRAKGVPGLCGRNSTWGFVGYGL